MNKRHLLPLLGALLLFSCSKDDESPSTEIPDKTVISSGVIGPGGGFIGSSRDSIIIEVPIGAFPESCKVSISAPDSSLISSDEQLSAERIISGIPADLKKPIRILLPRKNSGNDSADIAVIEKTAAPRESDSVYSFVHFSGKDSAGFIVGEIHPADMSTRSARFSQPAQEFRTAAVRKFDTITTAHFSVQFPIASRSKSTDLANSLESVYSLLADTLNLDMSKYGGWPLKIEICPLSAEGYMVPEGWFSYSYIQLSQNLVDNDPLKTVLGVASHEILHILQGATYEIPVASQWFDDMTASWVEGRMQASLSGLASVYAMQPFMGLRAGVGSADISDMNIITRNLYGANTQAQRHGYGMTTLFYYLISTYPLTGNHAMRQLFDKLAGGEDDPLAAIKSVFGKNPGGVDGWLADYYCQLLRGNCGGSVPVTYTETWTPASKTDTVKTIPLTAAELSAKLYEINLAKADSAGTIRISLGKGAWVSSWSVKLLRSSAGKAFEVVDSASGDDTISYAVKDAWSAKRLRVMVCNILDQAGGSPQKETLNIKLISVPSVKIESSTLTGTNLIQPGTSFKFVGKPSGTLPKSVRWSWEIFKDTGDILPDTTINADGDSVMNYTFKKPGNGRIICILQDHEWYDLPICSSQVDIRVSALPAVTGSQVAGFNFTAPMMVGMNGAAPSVMEQFEVEGDNNKEPLILSWSGNSFSSKADWGTEPDAGYEYHTSITGTMSEDGLTIKSISWDFERIVYSIDGLTDKRYKSQQVKTGFTASNIPFFKAPSDTSIGYVLTNADLLKGLTRLTHLDIKYANDGTIYDSTAVTGLAPADNQAWDFYGGTGVVLFLKTKKISASPVPIRAFSRSASDRKP